MLCYGGTAAVAAVPLLKLGRRFASPTLTLALAAAAVAAHFVALVGYAHVAGTLPLAGLGPSLSSLAFLVGLLVLATLWLTREPSFVLVALPLVVAPLAVAVLGEAAPAAAAPAALGPWFDLHVAASLLGLALLAVAFVAAALYVLQHRALKQRRFGVIFQFFPPLEQLDRLNHLALLAGFPALTVGILLAVGVAGRAGEGLGVSPAHLGWGLASWAVLGGVAVLRFLGRLRGRRAALASIAGFLLIAAAYLVLLATGGGQARFL